MLEDIGISVIDIGPEDNKSVDYPDFAAKAAMAISTGEQRRGILICGTGIGMSIVANKYPYVRGTLCHNIFTAKMAREHNDSNLLILGERVIDKELAREIVIIWLNTEFAGGRHARRLDKIKEIEKNILYKEKKSEQKFI